MLAGMAVTAADPSGLFGLVKEGLAASRALAEAKTDAAANELIKAVVADFETSEGRDAARDGLKTRFAGAKAADVKPKAIAALREVAALLDAKAPEDAAGLQGLARRPRPPRLMLITDKVIIDLIAVIGGKKSAEYAGQTLSGRPDLGWTCRIEYMSFYTARIRLLGAQNVADPRRYLLFTKLDSDHCGKRRLAPDVRAGGGLSWCVVCIDHDRRWLPMLVTPDEQGPGDGARQLVWGREGRNNQIGHHLAAKGLLTREGSIGFCVGSLELGSPRARRT